MVAYHVWKNMNKICFEMRIDRQTKLRYFCTTGLILSSTIEMMNAQQVSPGTSFRSGGGTSFRSGANFSWAAKPLTLGTKKIINWKKLLKQLQHKVKQDKLSPLHFKLASRPAISKQFIQLKTKRFANPSQMCNISNEWCASTNKQKGANYVILWNRNTILNLLVSLLHSQLT